MIPKISFQVTEQQKKLIQDFAKNEGLGCGSFCRFVILKKIKEEFENAETS